MSGSTDEDARYAGRVERSRRLHPVDEDRWRPAGGGCLEDDGVGKGAAASEAGGSWGCAAWLPTAPGPDERLTYETPS
jgi:hypothetical protein